MRKTACAAAVGVAYGGADVCKFSGTRAVVARQKVRRWCVCRQQQDIGRGLALLSVPTSQIPEVGLSSWRVKKKSWRRYRHAVSCQAFNHFWEHGVLMDDRVASVSSMMTMLGATAKHSVILGWMYYGGFGGGSGLLIFLTLAAFLAAQRSNGGNLLMSSTQDDENEDDGRISTLLRLRVALLPNARKLQRKLEDIAEKADTTKQRGLQVSYLLL